MRQAKLREAGLVRELENEKRLRAEERENHCEREERLLDEITQTQQAIDFAKHDIGNLRERETELLSQLHHALGRLRTAEEAKQERVNQGVQTEGMVSCFDNTEDEKQKEPERLSDGTIQLLMERLAVCDENLESERKRITQLSFELARARTGTPQVENRC